VTASFYDEQGRPLGNATIVIDPLHRGTLRLNKVVTAGAFATFVTASVPIVAERPMYTGNPNGSYPSGTDVLGSNGGYTAATFADGSTEPRTHEDILLLNPTAKVLLLFVQVFSSSGMHGVQTTLRIPPLAKHSIDIAALLHGQPPGNHGAVLRSLNGVGFVAEQTIYTMQNGRLTLRSTQALVQ